MRNELRDKLLKTLEASTRIELVYTDLQSTSISFKNKYLGVKWYQDKRRMLGEPDTTVFYTMTGVSETAGLI